MNWISFHLFFDKVSLTHTIYIVRKRKNARPPSVCIELNEPCLVFTKKTLINKWFSKHSFMCSLIHSFSRHLSCPQGARAFVNLWFENMNKKWFLFKSLLFSPGDRLYIIQYIQGQYCQWKLSNREGANVRSPEYKLGTITC